MDGSKEMAAIQAVFQPCLLGIGLFPRASAPWATIVISGRLRAPSGGTGGEVFIADSYGMMIESKGTMIMQVRVFQFVAFGIKSQSVS